MADFLRISWQTFAIVSRAYPVTLALSGLSFLFALLLGFVIGFLKHSRLPPVRILGALYINLFRNIPYIILIFTVFYGAPMLFEWHISAFYLAVVSLSLNQAAYFAEIIRGGLTKQQPGQLEAAEALGLGALQRLRFIVVPQVILAVAPSLMGQATQLIKSTAVVSIIGIKELTGVGRTVVISTHKPLLCFTWVALFYFATCFMLQLIARKMERSQIRVMLGRS